MNLFLSCAHFKFLNASFEDVLKALKKLVLSAKKREKTRMEIQKLGATFIRNNLKVGGIRKRKS